MVSAMPQYAVKPHASMKPLEYSTMYLVAKGGRKTADTPLPPSFPFPIPSLLPALVLGHSAASRRVGRAFGGPSAPAVLIFLGSLA